MSNPLPAYNDDNVPFASIPPTDIKRGPTGSATTIVTAAIFESPSFMTPSNRIHRPNSIGGPNGNVLVNTQETASGTVQLALATTETIKNGDWFSFVRDGKGGATAETWVFETVSDGWETNSYRKHNFTAFLAHNPP